MFEALVTQVNWREQQGERRCLLLIGRVNHVLILYSCLYGWSQYGLLYIILKEVELMHGVFSYFTSISILLLLLLWHLVFYYWSVLKVGPLDILQGVVAFSEHGLMIRWWSVGSVWWEKLSRNFVPVQCTKVIFVPPWEGFSPNSSRLSIMASATERHTQAVDVQVISSLWRFSNNI